MVFESPLADHPGWNVIADIDDSGDVAEILRLSVVRQDHPAAGVRLDLEAAGSVSAAHLRSVRLTEIVEAANEHLRYQSPVSVPDPAKQRANSPEFYAAWAARYVDLVKGGSRSPIADLAEEMGKSREQIRDLVHACRAKGYLTKGRRGLSGGELTDVALKVLKATR